MTDRKLSRKRPQHLLSGRIAIICILLLAIPLLIHNSLLYWEDYKTTVVEWQDDMQVIARERAHLIDAWIEPGDSVTVTVKGVSVGGKLIPPQEIGEEIPLPHPVQLAIVDGSGRVLWQNRAMSPNAELLSATAPIGSTQYIMRASLDGTQIHQLHLETYAFRFLSLALMVGGIGGILVYLFIRRVSRPLNNLRKTMDRVFEGAIHVRYQPDWLGFEINDLGLQFNETMDSLLASQEEALVQRQGREKLAEELKIGHEIQLSLLPKHVPGISGLDIGTSYRAAQEVNGDFYDFHVLPDGKFLVVVCDTAGKGIPACLYSLGLRSILRTLASKETDLATIIQKAGEIYYNDAHASSMFSTLWVGIYDPKTSQLRYCSQGHPPGLLLRNGKLQPLMTEGAALGANEIEQVDIKQIRLEKGDSLWLYTDGILDALNSEQELFGKKRLNEWLAQAPKGDAQELARQLTQEIERYSSGVPQHDDITLVVMKVMS